MKTFVALLRAVNVGGTGKLPMSELRTLCEEAGFASVRTYIQSGNVLFESKLAEKSVLAKLEKILHAKMGKPVGVVLRTADELDDVIARNPFPKADPKRLIVLFLNEAPPKNALDDVKVPGDEEIRLSKREVFIHYGDGMANSKLKFPLMSKGTGRNLNTVMKLAGLARDAE